MRYIVKVNGKEFDVEIQKVGGDYVAPVAAPVAAPAPAAPAQAAYAASHIPPVIPAPAQHTPTAPMTSEARNIEVLSPMPSNVYKILVDVGQKVNEGDTLIILEAMKMEIEVNAPESGVIKQILVNVGSSVEADDVLIVMN